MSTTSTKTPAKKPAAKQAVNEQAKQREALATKPAFPHASSVGTKEPDVTDMHTSEAPLESDISLPAATERQRASEDYYPAFVGEHGSLVVTLGKESRTYDGEDAAHILRQVQAAMGGL